MKSNENNIPPIVTINQLKNFMGISRSRFYQLLGERIILPPIYCIENKRPYYTREMAERNIRVIKENQGVNGQICLFYSKRKAPSANLISYKKKCKQDHQNSKYKTVVEGLEALGIDNPNVIQIESIINRLFPGGTEDQEPGEVLKAVFRIIAEQNQRDNVEG